MTTSTSTKEDQLYSCSNCKSQGFALKKGHYCRPLNNFLCDDCVKTTRHAMYCGDKEGGGPVVPVGVMMEQPRVVAKRATLSRTQSLPRQQNHKNNHMSSGIVPCGRHFFHHIQEGEKMLLYCRHCALIVRPTFS